MNDRDRSSFERIIEGMGEVKAELIALSTHVQTQNGTVARHLKDDLAFQKEILEWQKQQEILVATTVGIAKGRSQVLNTQERLIILLPSLTSMIIALYAVLK